MRGQRNVLQKKEQDKISKKELNEIELSNLPDKDFKVVSNDYKDMHQT